MEENENVEVNDTVVNNVSENGGGLKSKKGLIVAIIVAIIVICIAFNLFFNTKGKAKSVIKDYCTALGKGKYQKALKAIDPVGMYTFQDLSKDEYEDFWEEYKEFKKSDEWEEAEEEWKDYIDEAKDAEEDFDKDDAVKIKVKKIIKFKKIGKNLYEVKAKVESKDDDDDDDVKKMTFYVMKDGLNCKLVGGDAVSLLAVGFSSF